MLGFSMRFQDKGIDNLSTDEKMELCRLNLLSQTDRRAIAGWSCFWKHRGPLKGPRGPFKGTWGPLKGPRGPFKGTRVSFKRTPGSVKRTPGSFYRTTGSFKRTPGPF